jgi:hypothetical protein
VVEKQITKESTKRDGDRFNSVASPMPGSKSSSIRNVSSPVAGWGRNPSTVKSSSGSTHSGDSKVSSKYSSATSKLGDKLSQLSAEEKFMTDKGKQTSAPRGRGGGVPPKQSEVAASRANARSVRASRSLASQQGFRTESRVTASQSQPGQSNYIKTWDKTKVWSGSGVTPRPFKGFEHVSCH